MAKHVPRKKFEDIPARVLTTVGPEECVATSVGKQTNTVEVKEEAPPAWRVSLGSNEIHNGQTFSISPRDLESVEAKNTYPTALRGLSFINK